MSASSTEDPVVLIAEYPDVASVADEWTAVKNLVDDAISFYCLVLVTRRQDGEIHLEDEVPLPVEGSGRGRLGRALAAQLMPMIVQTNLDEGSAGTRLLPERSLVNVRIDVEGALPHGRCGIVAVCEPSGEPRISALLASATARTTERIDGTVVDVARRSMGDMSHE